MELQDFINHTKDYITEFKKHNLKVINIKKYNCILVKTPHNEPIDYQENYWKMYCRGAIIDIIKNKVVCLPPVKGIEYDFSEPIDFNNSEIQSLIDGTMINLFFMKNEWIISTRSEIGGYNKWKNKKSFRQMFDECSTIDYSVLNKDYSYSFVMKHIENRNISPITKNELYLVEIYSYGFDSIRRLFVQEYPEDILKIENNSPDILKNMKNDYTNKGYTIKIGNKRYTIISPEFKNVKSLKINKNNDLLNYIELRQNGNLKKYLKYFPEHCSLFHKYREKIHKLSNNLYSEYKNAFIFKKSEKKNIPYYLKPLLYDIHNLYKKNKTPITWLDIKNYIHTLPSKKLTFALNYLE
tara:strand:+ start:135 stop:1193 length:1059 start_codon:yes stop_codon:yes gene_type:complete